MPTKSDATATNATKTELTSSTTPTEVTTLPLADGIDTQTLEMYSESDLMPKRFRGKLQLTLELLNMSRRHGIDIYRLASGIYEVHGELSIDAKFSVALLNESGRIKGPLRYSFNEPKSIDQLVCTVTARDAAINEDVSWSYKYITAKNLGLVDASKHWKGNPRNMMAKRVSTEFIRNTYPEVLFGMMTREEAQEVHDLAEHEKQAEISSWIKGGITLTDADE